MLQDSRFQKKTTCYGVHLMSKAAIRTKASPARLTALEVGRVVRERRAFAQELISSHIDSSSLSQEDRAFATRLVLGVVSSYGTLDEIINRFVKKPNELESPVRDALRISVYEILFLGKTDHAAVDQGVELVKSINIKAGGLANAVLRRVVEAKESFPFGDIGTDDAAAARYFAFPLWLAKRLIADLGREAALAFMAASNEPAPIFIAVNVLQGSTDEVEDVFARNRIQLKKISIPGASLQTCYRVLDSRGLQLPDISQLFVEGKILVSDAASQFIAYISVPDKRPEAFLEIGSGRATKSILLQSNAMYRFGQPMNLSILDSHSFKIDLAKKRLREYGVPYSKAYVGDARCLEKAVGSQSFDAIFIDAPCSGLGTLRRHPEIRWKIKPEDITNLARSGEAMLQSAAQKLKVGGQLSYATCTVMKEENQELIARFLRSKEGRGFEMYPTFGKNSFSTVLQPGSSDAHFAVRMVRKS